MTGEEEIEDACRKIKAEADDPDSVEVLSVAGDVCSGTNWGNIAAGYGTMIAGICPANSGGVVCGGIMLGPVKR